MYLRFIYKNLIILSPLQIVTLNFTLYILTNLTCSLKRYVIRKKIFCKAAFTLIYISIVYILVYILIYTFNT